MFHISRLVGLACLALTACSSVQRYHVPPRGIVDDVTSPERVLYGTTQVRDARTISQAFLTAYERAYDASLVTRTTTASDIAGRDTSALEMTRLGMTVIEVRCDTFFETIGRGSQRLDFARREVEILSTALTTVLGFAGASETLVAASGVGSGVALGSIANYQNAFFFSPDVGKVQHLVDDALDAMRNALLAPGNAPRDFEGAVRALKRYQSVCTAHEIKRLVNEAVEKGTVRATFPDRDGGGRTTATDVFFKRISDVLEVPMVDVSDVALIKWVVSSATPTSDMLDFICPNLTGADLRKAVCEGSLGQRTLSTGFVAKKADLIGAIGAIDALSPALLGDKVALWQKAELSNREALAQARTAAATAARANKDRESMQAELKAMQIAKDGGAAVNAIVTPSDAGTQAQPSVTVVKGN